MRFEAPFRPEDVAYDGQRLDVLERHFEKLHNQGMLQGAAYCLSKDDKVFALGAMGSQEMDSDKPMPVNAVFQIASITKLFTAVAIMKLVEDGYFRLDEPVSVLLEEFKEPPFDKITFAHLLTHTSGLQADDGCFPNVYFLSPWECVERGFMAGDKGWVKNSLRSGMRREAGTEWAYSSFGFVLLGEAVSRAVGYSVEKFIKEEILVPCEMNDSGFKYDFNKELLPRFSYGNDEHCRLKKRLAGETQLTEIDEMWNLVPGTGGGLISTVEDLSKFGNMMIAGGYYHGKRVIGRKAIEKMTSRHTGSDIREYCWNNGGVERAYGLGPDLRNNLSTIYSAKNFHHEGWGSSCLMMDPTENFVAAWYVPYKEAIWHAEGLYNASSIMWSGIK